MQVIRSDMTSRARCRPFFLAFVWQRCCHACAFDGVVGSFELGRTARHKGKVDDGCKIKMQQINMLSHSEPVRSCAYKTACLGGTAALSVFVVFVAASY